MSMESDNIESLVNRRYEHGFVNMTADIMRVLGGQEPVVPLPDFADAYETQRVLEAAMMAAKHRAAVKLSDVK